MSQNREYDREAAPARAEEALRDEAPRAESAGAAHAMAAAGIYAAARGTGRVNAQALRALAGAIGNQAMLRLAQYAAGPQAPLIPEMDFPAPVSEAAAGAQTPVTIPEFM